MVKFLIIKTSALGDIVHVFPSIRLIKNHFPEATIDWVIEKRNASLATSNPYVDRVIEVDTKKWKKSLFSSWNEIKASIKSLKAQNYDFVFDFQSNLKSGVMTALAKGKKKVGFGWSTVAERPNLLFTNQHVNPIPGRNIRLDYLSLVEEGLGIKGDLQGTLLKLEAEDALKLKEFRERKDPLKHILVCQGSQWPNKRASKEQLGQLLQQIQGLYPCKFWFLYGSEQEKIEAELLSGSVAKGEVLGNLSFSLLQHTMKEMDTVLAMDSFPLHLAAEANVPTFSIFGASSSYKYQPLGKLHHSFQGTCPYGQTFTKRCPILRSCKTGTCIKNLAQEELFQAFQLFSLGTKPLLRYNDGAGELGEVSVSN